MPVTDHVAEPAKTLPERAEQACIDLLAVVAETMHADDDTQQAVANIIEDFDQWMDSL